MPELIVLDRLRVSHLPRKRPAPSKQPKDGEPSAERIRMAGGYLEVGDDEQGRRIYAFRDSTMDRLYARLVRVARGRDAEEQLRREYTALMKYKHHWHAGGQQSSMASMDLNRVFASDPSSMSGMAKTEAQAHHRKQSREARDHIGHRSGIVLDNVVCGGHSLIVGGHSVGYAVEYAARGATRMLRDSGAKLARFWGIG